MQKGLRVRSVRGRERGERNAEGRGSAGVTCTFPGPLWPQVCMMSGEPPHSCELKVVDTSPVLVKARHRAACAQKPRFGVCALHTLRGVGSCCPADFSTAPSSR